MDYKWLASKIKIKSLRNKIILYVIFSLILALLVFLLLFNLIKNVATPYLLEPMMQGSFNEAKKDYIDFVAENNISSRDVSEITAWSRNYDEIFIFPIVSDDQSENIETEEKRNLSDLSYTDSLLEDYLYINYSDGIFLTIFLYVPTSATKIMLAGGVGIFVFLFFSFVLYKLLRPNLDYIIEIEKGISILESGDLTHKIAVNGDDELGRLALSLNYMSHSLEEKNVTEARLIKSNKEIIGNLSHDIRTPLTAIIGYLTLANDKKTNSDEKEEYLMLALKKTNLIKDRTQELLEFATIQSNEQTRELVAAPAELIFTQFVNELSYMYEIGQSGEIRPASVININEALIERLFDNLSSNLEKYSDRTEKIKISFHYVENSLCVVISNKVDPAAESIGNSLGLKICQNIMEQHGGNFDYKKEADCFIVTMTFPVK